MLIIFDIMLDINFFILSYIFNLTNIGVFITFIYMYYLVIPRANILRE